MTGGTALLEVAEGRRTLAELRGIGPDTLGALTAIGHLLYQHGRDAEAIEIFEGLVALDPRAGYPHRALGLLYLRAQKLPQAVHHLNAAVQAEAATLDDGSGGCLLAEALLASGRADEALRAAERAAAVARDGAVRIRATLLARRSRG